MLAAAAQLRRQRTIWQGTLTVACVVDEEYRFQGTLALMAEADAWDFAVVGEPTMLQVVRGCKGCVRFSIRARGRAAHSSRPERGRNAIVAMARAVLELDSIFEALSRNSHKEFGSNTCSVGLIKGGSGINIVPDDCQIDVDVRLVPGQDPIQMLRHIESTLRNRMAAVKDIEWSFEAPSVVDPAYEISAHSPLVSTACEVAGNSDSQVVFYSCDASKIALNNIPCIILGPGDIAAAHTADESIALTQLESGTETYLRLAHTLMPVGSGSGDKKVRNR
jgi:acetylornithine deacetylase